MPIDIFPRYTVPVICLAVNVLGGLIVLFDEYLPIVVGWVGWILMYGGLLAFWVSFLAIATL